MRQLNDPRFSGEDRLRCDLLAHAQHPVNLGDTQPVQDIRHQCLEAHVFHAGNVLSPLKIFRRTIFPAFPSVIHHYRSRLEGQHLSAHQERGRQRYCMCNIQYYTRISSTRFPEDGIGLGSFSYLCNLPEGATFFAEVNDNAGATILCLLDGLLDTKDQVRSASTDIGAKNVTSIALREGKRGPCQLRLVSTRGIRVIPRRGCATQAAWMDRTCSPGLRRHRLSDHLGSVRSYQRAASRVGSWQAGTEISFSLTNRGQEDLDIAASD